jgi:2-polyprenyl-3-methyl-5-hydroxy-6-metoxy-1,4-benzoquinol methylase
MNQPDGLGMTHFADIGQRRRRPELMDQPELDAREHRRALRGLARINAVSRTRSALWPPIARLAREQSGRGSPVRILDIATGGGDTPLALWRRAARVGMIVEVAGCDRSAEAVRFAQDQAKACGAGVRFFVLDALADALPAGYDVLCCSLFLHHLDDSEAVELLRRMGAAARRAVLVDDLVRSRLGHVLALVGCRLLSRSPVVVYDGPVSVNAAFTMEEARELARRAGVRDVAIERHWPERYLMSWSAG